MNRKVFLQKFAVGSLVLGCLPQFRASSLLHTADTKHICILHTNDQHSRIDPFDSNDSRNANKGGMARRAKLINDLRQQNQNILLLDAGDVFQGTAYFNFYGGELEFKLMSLMKYDACTMGNHDFDNGLEGFKKQLPHAKFPFLCSNYDFKNTILEGLTQDYKIFNKDGVRIGVFGVGIEFEGLVSKSAYKETKCLNAIEIAQHYADFLRKEKKCDLVICLSHLGFDYKENPKKISDINLAKQTSNIDLILGGHTHTFLKEPISFMNKEGLSVLVNQVGFGGLFLGKIDFYFDVHKKIKEISWNKYAIDQSIIV